MKLLGTSYLVASLQHPAKEYLKGMGPDVWADHLDYVLGKDVYGFRITATGTERGPEWCSVLSYEHSLRKAAVHAVLYGDKTFAAALKEARSDQELRSKSFTTPNVRLCQ